MSKSAHLKTLARRVASSIWFKLGVALTVLGILAYYNRIDLGLLRSSAKNWPMLLLAFVITLPSIALVSYRLQILLSTQRIDVSFLSALRWTMIGSFFDLVMPSSNGGDVIKAGYIAEHVGSGSRTEAVMAVLIDRVIGLTGLFLLAAVSSMIGWKQFDLPELKLVAILSTALGFAPLAAFRIIGARHFHSNKMVNRYLFNGRYGERIRRIMEAFLSLRHDMKTFMVAILLAVLNHIFWCSSLLIIARVAGYSGSPINGFIVFPIAIFGGVFGFAGGFGIGTAAFDFLLARLLLIQNGATVGLIFQTFGLLSRLLGLPFYLAGKLEFKKRVLTELT